MSRQSGPHGLPPKPAHRNVSDSYRPGNNREREHGGDRDRGRNDMYNFGGYDQRQRSPPRFYGRERSPPNYRNSRNDDYDYRPRGDDYGRANQDFTFRRDAPASISNNYENQRFASPPRQRRDNGTSGRNDAHQKRNNHTQAGQRGGYRGRAGPRLASNREFLKGTRERTPELLAGMDGIQEAKYLLPGEISDSDEAEMDISGDEDDGQPKKKQARTDEKAADGDSVPKWSNPDPYTELPPPDASSGPKKDILKLIRKARIEAAAGALKVEEPADDFISFNMDTPPAKTTPVKNEPVRQNCVSGASLAPSDSRAFKAEEVYENQLTPINTVAPNLELGSRKRTIRDEIKETPSLQDALRNARTQAAPKLHKSMQGKRPPASGNIMKEWLGHETPWLGGEENGADHSATASMGLWLHKEIMDFYEYVKPRDFEEFIRHKLVLDLEARIHKNFQGVTIRTFGSFPAGLYLPTADLDLVLISQEYLRGGRQVLPQSKNYVKKFGEWIQREGLPMPGSVELILHAKVPLVKYVDRLTGLKVDISFENKTGLEAVHTFNAWKEKYPAMPIIVTLVKHLLAMRGLNEPVNGGIGGFSVICLAVSLLQNMPQVQSGTMIAEHHLGEILMEFLDLYGNQFNWVTTGIQLNPPRYVPKNTMGNLPYNRNPNIPKMCIIDPNTPDNDISGGASNTVTILRCLSNCFSELQKSMGALKFSRTRRENHSLLGCILGGDYRQFTLQRQHLEALHNDLYGNRS